MNKLLSISGIFLLFACTPTKNLKSTYEERKTIRNQQFEQIRNSIIPPDGVYHENDVDIKPYMDFCQEIMGHEERVKCAERKMLINFYKSLKYPADARENGVQGLVVASFVIDEFGSMKDIQILQDIGRGCGQAVKVVLSQIQMSSTKWIPGKKETRNVKTLIIMPVNFNLEG